MIRYGPAVVAFWLYFGVVFAILTTHCLAARRTPEQQWVLGIVAFLLAPLVVAAWLLVGAWHAGRALSRGVGQWRHELMAPTVPPPDPLLREAEREVQQLLESERPPP